MSKHNIPVTFNDETDNGHVHCAHVTVERPMTKTEKFTAGLHIVASIASVAATYVVPATRLVGSAIGAGAVSLVAVASVLDAVSTLKSGHVQLVYWMRPRKWYHFNR